MIVLGRVFMNGSRQEEKINIEKYDRFGSPSYYLKDHGVKFYLFSYQMEYAYSKNDTFLGAEFEYLTPEIGYYSLVQYFPCDAGNTTCLDSKDGYQKRSIKFHNCSSEVSDELHAYYKSRNKLLGDFAR